MSHELKQRLFYQKLFLIPTFENLSKNGKRNWASVVLSSEMHYLSIGQGLTLSPMENYQVPLNILSSVYYTCYNSLHARGELSSANSLLQTV